MYHWDLSMRTPSTSLPGHCEKCLVTLRAHPTGKLESEEQAAAMNKANAPEGRG